MAITKSIVLTAICPSAKESIEDFCRAVDLFRAHGIGCVEYYTKPELRCAFGKALKESGLRSIFLAAIEQKGQHQDLCSLDEEERKAAVKACLEMAGDAMDAGAEAMLITGGWLPKNRDDIEKAEVALRKSIGEILQVCRGKLKLYLEPGDREVEFKQLIGPTNEAVQLAKDFEGELQLTMDISHMAQLGEDVYEVLTLSQDYTPHVHLANCILKPGAVWYGDKHPMFDVAEGMFGTEDAMAVYQWIDMCSEEKDRIVGVEVIHREGDEWQAAENLIRKEAWFFN